MFEVIFLVVLAFVWVLYATIQDLKMKEVANWLNFSLIIFALGFRFFWGLFEGNGFGFFYQGLIGLGIFLVLGNLFYYTRLFAGGDAKLMIALGAILPFTESFYVNLNIFIWFFFLFIFVGAFYGFFWSIFLAIKNYKSFSKAFSKKITKNKRFIYPILMVALLFLILSFISKLFLFVAVLVFLLPYFYLFAKTLEECCMIMEIPSSKLRPGDWLTQDIRIRKDKIILKNWEGLDEEEIKLIQKRFEKVKIKQGIAFVPVFLISFLILVYCWFMKNNFFLGYSWI